MTLASDAAAPRAAPDGDQDAGAPSGRPPEELIEAQLRSILECTQTSAGAVCLFDPHQELLRLAVEVGLSDEGCRKLRSVRRGAATTWDMPLHSLLNRRVYLIESAAKNRYVPPLVDDVATVRAVACIPLYDGSTPVGSLILIAVAPRTFGERQIRVLEQPVRELVASIVAMRSRVVTGASERTARASLSAGAPPAAAPLTGPNAPGVKTAPGAPVTPTVQATVDRARAELDRLRGRLTEAEDAAAAARTRAEELEQRQRELESSIAEAQAERDRLADTLAGRAHEIEAAEGHGATLQAELDALRGTEAALRAELAHANETSAAREAAASAGTATALALEARIAELEAANQHLRERTAGLEAAQTSGQAEVEQRVAAAAAEAEARLAARVAELDARLATVSGEGDTARARLAELEAAHAGTLAQLESRGAALADADGRATAAGDEAASWQRRHEAADVELAAAQARETALAARVGELEQELERIRSDDRQLRDGIANLESLIQTDTGDLAAHAEDDGIELGDLSSFELVEVDDDGADGGGVDLVVLEETGAAPAPATAPPPPAAPAASARAEGLLVLDTARHWIDVAPPKAGVTVQDPAAPPSDGAPPERILVNLAAPGALAAFAALRQAGVTAPAHALVGVPGQARGLLLGRFDVAARPLDPDALLSSLQGLLTRGTRVVTAGADVDGLISLRQALARLGVSVSMAWDAKQAADLLGMVTPDVAIIDLDLPPKDGCLLVARMALASPSPLTVVVPTAADRAAAFAEAVSRAELAQATLPAKELVTRVLNTPLKPAAKTATLR